MSARIPNNFEPRAHQYYLRSASYSSSQLPGTLSTSSSEASGSPRSDRSGTSPQIIKKKSSIWNIFRSRKKEEVEATPDHDSFITPIPRNQRPHVQSSRPLRSQQSLSTLRSQASVPTLRSARSQYTLRRPSGMPIYDADSILSDDSDDVSVSWVTSTGLRRAGIRDDDDDGDIIMK